jgi:hypothetical protein
MSTVNPNPVQPKTVTGNSIPQIVNVKLNDYSRPTAGGNATGDAQTAPGVIPGAGAYAAPAAAPVSTGGTQVGPDFGHGATIVIPDSGDRPSGGKADANKGTVGDSGPGLGQ